MTVLVNVGPTDENLNLDQTCTEFSVFLSDRYPAWTLLGTEIKLLALCVVSLDYKIKVTVKLVYRVLENNFPRISGYV